MPPGQNETGGIIIIPEGFNITQFILDVDTFKQDVIETRAELRARAQFLAGKVTDLEFQQDQLAAEMIAHVQEMQGMYYQSANLTLYNETVRDYVLGYIQQNGLMVSGRWRIGEEVGSNGALVIRDLVSSIILGVDARYAFAAGVKKDL